MTQVVLNGALREVSGKMNVVDFLAELGLEGQPLLVEHNGTALLKSEWMTTLVRSGDRLELVRVVAGG